MRVIAARISVCISLGIFLSCSHDVENNSIIGEWWAVAIHLPEGLSSEEGSDRLAIQRYGNGWLKLERDSTFESQLKVTKDIKVIKRIGFTEATISLVEAGTNSKRIGDYHDSSGYLLLEQPDIRQSSRMDLANGVLTTTSIIKGFPIQIIWHRSN
jgi:hypothetical protein